MSMTPKMSRFANIVLNIYKMSQHLCNFATCALDPGVSNKPIHDSSSSGSSCIITDVSTLKCCCLKIILTLYPKHIGHYHLHCWYSNMLLVIMPPTGTQWYASMTMETDGDRIWIWTKPNKNILEHEQNKLVLSWVKLSPAGAKLCQAGIELCQFQI